MGNMVSKHICYERDMNKQSKAVLLHAVVALGVSREKKHTIG
jgi:hypothetical protein